MDGYRNLDPAHGEGIYRFAIGIDREYRTDDPRPIPAGDGTVEAVRASHVMEHIPAGAPRLWVMNEVHRVLAPGGTFTIIVPLIGTWHAIADPTHVSFWVPESFNYFDGTQAPHADYGILPWETIDFTINKGWEGHWFARPVKRGDQ